MPYHDRELANYARPRHNALSFEELTRDVGISTTGITRRLDRGTLHRVGPQVYVFGSGSLSFQGRARIGAILGGVGSGVHLDATLALFGIVEYEPTTIDVLTPRRRAHREYYRMHGSRSVGVDPLYVDHVPTVSVERAIRGLAAVRSTDRLTKLMQSARYHHRLDMRRLSELAHELRCTPGHRTMMEALDAFSGGDNGAWSGVERRGWSLLADVVADERPIRNQHVRIDGRNTYVDIRWPRSAVSVELDGPPHLYADVLRDDAAKDRRLRSIGDLVIRVPWFDLTRRGEQVRADVRRSIIEHRALVAMR